MEMEQLLSNELLEWLQSDIEIDADRLLLVASDSYEKSLCPSNEPSPLKTFLHVHRSGIPAAPKTEEEICNARAKGVPSKTVEGRMSSVAYRRPGILPWCPLRHRPQLKKKRKTPFPDPSPNLSPNLNPNCNTRP